jgi:hypothetical protein
MQSLTREHYNLGTTLIYKETKRVERIARGDGTKTQVLEKGVAGGAGASRRGHALERLYAWLCEEENAPEDNAQKGSRKASATRSVL